MWQQAVSLVWSLEYTEEAASVNTQRIYYHFIKLINEMCQQTDATLHIQQRWLVVMYECINLSVHCCLYVCLAVKSANIWLFRCYMLLCVHLQVANFVYRPLGAGQAVHSGFIRVFGLPQLPCCGCKMRFS